MTMQEYVQFLFLTILQFTIFKPRFYLQKQNKIIKTRGSSKITLDHDFS